jgi:hypothetical protein
MVSERRRSKIFIVWVFSISAACALSEDLRRKYVGQSNCSAELKSADHYGIRLDKTQRAYLDAYQWGGKNVLAVVQRKQEGEGCGVIRDLVQSRDVTSSFIFECTSRSGPSDVIVGTWPQSHRGASGSATESWKIDLKDLTFNEVKGSVDCFNRDYSGKDEGDDLATWAKARAAKSRSTVKP